MTTFQRLKHEARKAEQRSDWRRAIALYREAMRFDDHVHGSSELGLFNRIGDLHIRLGEIPQAVECYEQAADRYAENELPTSAIALCNKILRVAPERTDVYRRLGVLHAATGLIAEARAATLQYLDRMEQSGSLGEALDAVQEFVDRTGEESLRSDVADLLADRGHRNQALAQLRLATAAGRREGTDTSALETRIEELAADGDLPLPEVPQRDASAVAGEAEPDIEEAPAAVPASELRLGERLATALGDMPTHARLDGTIKVPVADGPEGESAPGRQPNRAIAEALERFRAAVQPELDRAGPALHYDLGVAFQAMGLEAPALEALRRGIDAPGRLHAAHDRLAMLLRPDHSGPTGAMQPADAGAVSDPAGAGVSESFESVVAEPEEPEEIAEPSQQLAPAEPTEDGEAPDSSAEELHPDLQGLLFRARLAQYQIRRAQDAGRTDHRSYLDLGTAYAGMGLRVEAVRELTEALTGPGPVAARATTALLDVSRDPETPWDLALSILERLRESGDSGDGTRPVLHELLGRWEEDHPGRARVSELLGWVMTATEPEPETDEPERTPEAAAGVADAESLEALDDLLERLEGTATDPVAGAEMAADPALAVAEAETLLAGGREQEAVSELFRALEAHEDARQVREASAILERLLQLRPDDVVLHHQRAEFALTLDDREMLVDAYLNLARCLGRQQAMGSARTVYGRVLDVDPENVEARSALRGLSMKDRGASGAAAAVPEGLETSAEPERSPAEFDLLLQDLKDPGPGQDALGGDADAHFELGIAFKQMEMWDEALAELESALPGLADPVPVWSAMAECHQKAGRSDAAEEILLEAERRSAGPGGLSVALLYRLAVLLQERGETDEARHRLQRVVELDPSFRDAAARLSALSR